MAADLNAKRRLRLQAKAPPIAPDKPLLQLIRAPHISKMETLSSCRRVLRNILKAMAAGDVPSGLGARLAYVANLIAQIVKLEQEHKELLLLREQLQRLQSAPLPTLLAPDVDSGTAPINGECLDSRDHPSPL